MNVQLLIDAIVRETTVLIAQLATSGGLRAPLAHVASQVFAELAAELEREGVPKKVSADMFGLALRTYQRRTQWVLPSLTDRGRSLWQVVLDYIAAHELATRDELLQRFRHDDERSVRGVLRDLTESGLVFASGRGSKAAYRVSTRDELTKMRRVDRDATEAFVWSAIFRDGPLEVDRLLELTRLAREELEPVLAALLASGRIDRLESAGASQYRARELVLGFEDPSGWEASVQDHFAALARTVTRKLRLDPRASRGDEVGGSTYHFELWRGHPFEELVLGELRRFRERMTALRAQIDQHNDAVGRPSHRLRVDAYYGQSLVEYDEPSEPIAEHGHGAAGALDGDDDDER
jgi:hypothetical protein